MADDASRAAHPARRERQRLAEHQLTDILGYGWRVGVGGLSAIHRCVKNRAGATC